MNIRYTTEKEDQNKELVFLDVKIKNNWKGQLNMILIFSGRMQLQTLRETRSWFGNPKGIFRGFIHSSMRRGGLRQFLRWTTSQPRDVNLLSLTSSQP